MKFDYERWLSEASASFPHLTASNSRPTSPVNDCYNCIAWAAGDHERWWWPDANYQYYWPSDVQRAETIPAFVEAFAKLGFEQCATDSYQAATEKLALFVNAQGRPTHAARQLRDGWWTSKLGKSIDIEHALDAVCGPCYGTVAMCFARLGHSEATR